MFYISYEWFLPPGGVSERYASAASDALLERFYIGQCYSPVAWQMQDLHVRILLHWWNEATLDAAGQPTSMWTPASLCRHWKYALDPPTMVFHHRRLASVFWCPQAIPVLARSASTAARTQRKAFRTLERIKVKRWLDAVSINLLYAFNHQKGSTDVTGIVVKLLEAWEKQQPRDRSYASYFLDEAVEHALLGASITYAPSCASSKRPKLC